MVAIAKGVIFVGATPACDGLFSGCVTNNRIWICGGGGRVSEVKSQGSHEAFNLSLCVTYIYAYWLLLAVVCALISTRRLFKNGHNSLSAWLFLSVL